VIKGYLSVTFTGSANTLDLVLNATKTPSILQGANYSFFVNPNYEGLGGTIITASGKLKMSIGNPAAWGSGTYEFGIDISYLAG